MRGATVSDTTGCIDLVGKKLAEPSIPLEDEKCPTLMVLAELSRRHWRPRKEFRNHTHALLEFDAREPVQSKYYYQCLLGLPAILDRQETKSFPSAQPQTFYKLLLTREAPLPNQGDKFYKEQLRAVTEGRPILRARLALPAPPLAPVLQAGSDEDDSDGGFAIVGLAQSQPARAVRDVAAPKPKSVATPVAEAGGHPIADRPPAPGRPPRSPSPSSSSSSSSSSSTSSSSVAFQIGGKRSEVGDWVKLDSIHLQPLIKYDSFKSSKQKEYARIIMKCQ